MLEKAKFLLQDKTNKLILFALLLSGLALVIINSSNSTGTKKDGDKQAQEQRQDDFTADTVIPKGFVLVPIEIQNIESLASMIGQFGVIDLFTTPNLNQKSGLRVGRKLKLLRAPLNPQQFAVLVPENEAGTILQATGPFTAVIQNPADNGQSEVIAKSAPGPRQPQVEYFRGTHK